MPDTTPIFGFPFPEDSDPTDVPGDIEALALGVETDLNAHLVDTTAAHAASAISVAALTGISATDVQAALAELIAEAFPLGWGAWTAYTPAVTQGATLTKSSNCAYTRLGQLIVARYSLAITSAGTANTPLQVALPVAAVAGLGSLDATGAFTYFDTGTAVHNGVTVFGSTTSTIRFRASSSTNSAAFGETSGSTPAMTAANGDSLGGFVVYQAA